MPKGSELKAMIGWIQANVQDDEPFVLRFPRRESRRRIQNTEKRRRITMATDEQNYAEFHAMREAYMLELNENPTLVTQAIIEAMKAFDVRGWKDSNNAESTEIT
jgi:hypothetical protein